MSDISAAASHRKLRQACAGAQACLVWLELFTSHGWRHQMASLKRFRPVRSPRPCELHNAIGPPALLRDTLQPYTAQ